MYTVYYYKSKYKSNDKGIHMQIVGDKFVGGPMVYTDMDKLKTALFANLEVLGVKEFKRVNGPYTNKSDSYRSLKINEIQKVLRLFKK